jgi:nucleoid-associated protein EbfC
MPGLNELMQQAQEFTRKLAQMKEELGRAQVVGAAGGGMVRVEASGAGRILRVSVEPQLLRAEDREMLEDLVCAATNQALDRARELSENATRALTGGLSIPGLENLLP